MSIRRLPPALQGILLLAVTLPLTIRFGNSTLWFLVPFTVITLSKQRYEDFGLSLQRPGSASFHLKVTLLVFGSYCILHYAFARMVLGLQFHPSLPPDFARQAAERVFEQMLAIALPEEFFFRGYLQTQLNRGFGRPWRILGADCGPGLVLAAVLFGACHLVYGNISHLDRILPGLFFGWLRERTGTIAVPALYHGAANLIAAAMIASLH